jgi:hypothetical protein
MMTPETQAKLLDAAKRALVEMETYGKRSHSRYQFLCDAIAQAEKEQGDGDV